MKKLFCCFCALLLILSVCSGCGTDKPEADPGSTGETASVSAPSETAPSTTEAATKGLAFEMREENFEHRTSAGELFATNQVKYPYFLGSSEVETAINSRYAGMIENYRNGPEDDVDGQYQNMAEIGALDRLPLYDNIEATVTYNENGYLSILEWSHFWGGGAHPYHYEAGLNFDVNTAAQLDYVSFFEGGKAAADRLLTALGEEENAGRDGWFEDSQFVLTPEGIRFYIWHGDAVARQELLVPYTEGAAPFVVPEEVPASAAQTQSLSDEEIKALFIKANDLYVGWLGNAFTPELDWDRKVNVDGTTYVYIVPTQFDSVSALEAELRQIFSEELYRERVAHYYKMIDGEFYGIEALGQGGDMPADSLTLTVNSAADTDVTFTVTTNWTYEDPFSRDYHLRLIDGNWIFTDSFVGSMDLYFHPDMPWTD